MTSGNISSNHPRSGYINDKYPTTGPKQDCFKIVKLYIGYLDVFWFAGNLVFVRWLCTVGKNRVANSNAAEVVKSLVLKQ